MTLSIEYKGACDGVGWPVVVDGLARGAAPPVAGAAAENKEQYLSGTREEEGAARACACKVRRRARALV